MSSVSISVIRGIPEIREGDPLTEILAESINSEGISLVDGDILCIAHKIVSKAEGRIIHLADV